MVGVPGRSGGHNRKPTSVLKREGGFRRCRHGDRSDINYDPTELKPPRGLGRDGAWLWRLVVDATPRGVLTTVDTPQLFALCKWWGRWRRLDRKSDLNAFQLRQMLQSWKQFSQLATQFGLSPSARAGLKVPTQTPDPLEDPFLKLMAMRDGADE